MLDFTDSYVVVMGGKRSGQAATELLQNQGAFVRVMDSGELSEEDMAAFDELDVEVVEQDEANLSFEEREPDFIVLSPGVPFDLPMVVAARERGVPTIGEVELASYFLLGSVIGITGSNGKTTTTALTGHLLHTCGVPCQVGGNIGNAVASLVETSKEDQWNVLELSSFQLEAIDHFRATIGACLNVTPDHLDRHHTFEAYAAAKGRLFETQDNRDFAVLNYDDAVCRSYAEQTKAQVFWFSVKEKVPHGVWLDGEQICYNAKPFMTLSQIKLRGMHNVENVMAAALLAHLAGAKLKEIGPAVESFGGVEHRIEFVRELEGVLYFNDSKATNVDAALKAIHAFPANIWIILGGKDKGSDYTPLREPLHERAKAVLLIGAEAPYEHAAAPLIKHALEGAVELVDCGTLDVALQHARKHSAAGDIVLLAPACASFDQFENYEERGDVFKHLVSELI
jgi:UDP-N-acetylmuramoylalanine--D-glutamate ligase